MRVVLGLMLAIACLGAAGDGSPLWCAITVSTSDALRAAVETMVPGTTICLAPGAYRAGLVIRQSVVLRGAGRPEEVILEGSGEPDEPVIDFRESYGRSYYAVLENLTVRGAVGGEGNIDSRSDHGLYLDRGVHVLLRNVICTGNEGAGTFVDEGASLEAAQSTFSDNFHGVAVVGRSAARLDECVIERNRVGVSLADDAQIRLDDSLISGNADVGALLLCGQATLDDCEISDNGWGCILGAPYDPPLLLRMTDCDILRNREIGVAWLTAECYDPAVPEGAGALIDGSRNEIPGPDEEDGNAGGDLCPAYPGDAWPDGFARD